MANITIIGAGGQLGRALQQLAPMHAVHQWRFLSHSELDITDIDSLKALFKQSEINYLINCAAYTAVDRAEKEIEEAYALNGTAVKYLGEYCEQTDTHLIHFSTDYVYGGRYNEPISEDAATAPAGVYGASKLAGESHILPHATVIRTSWLYSNYGHNFVKTMLRLGRERDQLSVVYDQIGSPTLADDLAAVVLNMIEAVESGDLALDQLQGLFHFSNEGVASWYDFAQAIFRATDIACDLSPIRSAEYPTPASRPAYSVLDKTKIKSLLKIEIPHWHESLLRMLNFK